MTRHAEQRDLTNFGAVKRICCFLVLALILTACEKDLLIDHLEIFKGRYTWEYSIYREHWWSSDTKYRNADNFDYKAEIEFDSNSKVRFYIDGEEIHATRFAIESEEVLDNSIYLRIDPAIENVKGLDLNNHLDLTLYNDTLVVDDFPGESYDKSAFGSHYFIRN